MLETPTCAVPDEEVLTFAAAEARILLTQNRRHFLMLHNGIATFDHDFERLALRIHTAVLKMSETDGN